jgi:serine/threonine protein kinase
MTAQEINKIIGAEIDSWKVSEHLGSGKSAAVFKAAKGTQIAALKVFDPRLVNEFGKEAQLNRIQRELNLKNHSHPHLVKIVDGGECQSTNYLYVAMELIAAPNLASVLTKTPRDSIRAIISQIASAAKFLLEELDIVHRDIKPDNIVISPDFSHATLLDLGVIRPIDVPAMAASSDGDRQNFLGTLRYSPPEYLFRTEMQDKEGYRAMTFYQLGAVLYDLIMRERIFLASSSPYARLVKAVEFEIPKIQQTDIPQDLILLARNCLLKDPSLRLRFVKWEDFNATSTLPESVPAARERVMRRFASSLESELPVEVPKSAWDVEQAAKKIQDKIIGILKDICSGEKMFPRSFTRELPSLAGVPGANVLLVFESADSLHLFRSLALLITALIIDIEPESVEVTVRAVIGYEDSMEAQEVLKSAKELRIFQGVLDESVLTVALENAVFRVVDIAQTTGLTAGIAHLVI